jgi:hypothetical protein
MLKEALDHMDDCRGSARRHSLPGAPGVDFLDQLGVDPDVDVGCLPFHARKVGLRRAHRLDNPGQKLDCSLPLVG